MKPTKKFVRSQEKKRWSMWKSSRETTWRTYTVAHNGAMLRQIAGVVLLPGPIVTQRSLYVVQYVLDANHGAQTLPFSS